MRPLQKKLRRRYKTCTSWPQGTASRSLNNLNNIISSNMFSSSLNNIMINSNNSPANITSPQPTFRMVFPSFFFENSLFFALLYFCLFVLFVL